MRRPKFGWTYSHSPSRRMHTLSNQTLNIIVVTLKGPKKQKNRRSIISSWSQCSKSLNGRCSNEDQVMVNAGLAANSTLVILANSFWDSCILKEVTISLGAASDWKSGNLKRTAVCRPRRVWFVGFWWEPRPPGPHANPNHLWHHSKDGVACKIALLRCNDNDNYHRKSLIPRAGYILETYIFSLCNMSFSVKARCFQE